MVSRYLDGAEQLYGLLPGAIKRQSAPRAYDGFDDDLGEP